MRKSILTLVSAAALALPLFALAGPPAGAAAAGTSCKTTTGKATFTPPLPVASSSQKVLATITSTGKTSKCTGGGVTSGTVSGKFKFAKPGNCATLIQGQNGASKGTISVKWNNGKTSSGPATISQVSGKATEANVAGTVTSGLFKGLHSKLQVTFATSSAGGNCTTTPLKFVTFTNNGALTIH